MALISAVKEHEIVPLTYGVIDVLEFSSENYQLNALLQFVDLIDEGIPQTAKIQDILSWSPAVRDYVSQLFFNDYGEAKDFLESKVVSRLRAAISLHGVTITVPHDQLCAYEQLGWTYSELHTESFEAFHYFRQNEFIRDDAHALDLVSNLLSSQLINLQHLIETERPDDLTALVKLLISERI